MSRVGGKAQIPAMKQIAGSLRLDLAAFRELEAFAQLGTELDKATQSQLDRGYRMVEILKQPQFKPMHVVDQVMIIYAGTKGYLDKVPIKQVPAWEEQFLTLHARAAAGGTFEGAGEVRLEEGRSGQTDSRGIGTGDCDVPGNVQANVTGSDAIRNHADGQEK